MLHTVDLINYFRGDVEWMYFSKIKDIQGLVGVKELEEIFGNATERTLYQLNERGHVIVVKEYQPISHLNFTYTHNYFENDTLKEWCKYEADGTLVYRRTFEYNDRRQVMASTANEYNWTHQWTFRYDDIGNCNITEHLFDRDSLHRTITGVYDINALTLVKTEFSPLSEQLTRKTEYTFDNQGREISVIRTDFDSGEVISRWEKSYSYPNNEIQTIEKDNTGYQYQQKKWVNEHGWVYEQAICDNSGNDRKEFVEYRTDAFGHWTDKIVHIYEPAFKTIDFTMISVRNYYYYKAARLKNSYPSLFNPLSL